MLKGFVRNTSKEMSRDDFLETYGPTSVSSYKSESSDRSSSTSSSSTIQEQQKERAINYHNIPPQGRNRHPSSKINRAFSMDNVAASFNTTPNGGRRNSKFRDIAHKLSSKSFRSGPKKPIASYDDAKVSTPIKWNSLFRRRTQSVSRIPKEDISRYRTHVVKESNTLQSYHSSPTSSTHTVTPEIKRSLGPSVITSTHSKPSRCAARKNHTLRFCDNPVESYTFSGVTEEDGPTLDVHNERIPSPIPRSLSKFSPEYCLERKYDEIRENEQMRMVAIVTLLKRRKNSLKIKCDQFDKDLDSDCLDKERQRLIRSRLKHMKRKLGVVEQCIDEQKQAMKVTGAKLNLQLSLEMYQLELHREEKNLQTLTAGNQLRHHQNRRNGQLTSSGSCETLESVDEASVFGDATSTHLQEHKEDNFSTNNSPIHQRHYSVPHAHTFPCLSPKKRQVQHPELDGTPVDDVADTDFGRSRSVDCAVTSDCDSGFDNGEALSRSDVSLNMSLSKSNGSITSTSSRTCSSNMTTPSDGNKFFYTPQNPTLDLSLCCGDASKNGMKPSGLRHPSAQVDSNTLARIEDFERFAEQTMKRFSNKGKLVPLKKSC